MAAVLPLRVPFLAPHKKTPAARLRGFCCLTHRALDFPACSSIMQDDPGVKKWSPQTVTLLADR